MKDGTIFLQHNRKWGKWYENLVTWLITKMKVRGPFIHTQIFLRGWVYEFTIGGKSVARKTLRSNGAGTDAKIYGDMVREPIRDLTEGEVDLMIEWWEEQVGKKYKYATAKLLIQLVLGWTLPFWRLMYRWFGWEIMKSNKFWGEHCSAAVDESFKVGGIDLFPEDSEQYTTPSAHAYCPFFKTIAV